MSTAPAPHLWRQHLRRDVLFRTLVIQVKWLAAILAHAKTELASAATFRRRSADDCVKSTPQLHAALPFHDDMTPTYAPRTLSRWYSVLQLPLQDVLPPNDHTPSMAYLSFELFLLETGFDKSDVGQRLRHTAVTAHTADRPATMPPLHGLVFDIAAYLSHEHGVLPPCRRSTLDCLVRQMVHVRLAAAYCRDVATVVALAARKYDAIKPRMYELAVHDLSEVHIQQPVVLPQTRAALEAMPTFMPQAIAAAYMAAIRLLHVEVGEALHVPASTLSADVILPCLVGLFGQASLPDLAHQVHAMEMHLPPSCGEGEVAYYIALAHAALGAS
ncbi:hypothetical protein DYB32_003947 [Aphanomyces invadans]|uniref:Uncharacterized protein n=1 Tax=Aphanomyces invadans TaxID=157072 RepID=A0A3R6Z097_9STRA|nr:hypothetical protein DYB32_003947 [Aphanomyces invadans]